MLQLKKDLDNLDLYLDQERSAYIDLKKQIVDSLKQTTDDSQFHKVIGIYIPHLKKFKFLYTDASKAIDLLTKVCIGEIYPTEALNWFGTIEMPEKEEQKNLYKALLKGELKTARTLNVEVLRTLISPPEDLLAVLHNFISKFSGYKVLHEYPNTARCFLQNVINNTCSVEDARIWFSDANVTFCEVITQYYKAV